MVVALQHLQVVHDQHPESPRSYNVLSGTAAAPSSVYSLDLLSLVHLDRKNRLGLQQSERPEVVAHSALAASVSRICCFLRMRDQQLHWRRLLFLLHRRRARCSAMSAARESLSAASSALLKGAPEENPLATSSGWADSPFAQVVAFWLPVPRQRIWH